uniref:Uncharacterized protein n=1 Tax=Populus alba TaxID=43335 RepID=A0A4U5Q788_POPAL|nr:hypothetical protein D5086_0000146500 [Populus alba]
MLEGYDGNNSFLANNGNEELISEESQEEMVTPEITLHALTGWTMPKIIRISVKIGSHHVTVLIDSGSTHNFISERMANLLRLSVMPSYTFSVRVANEENLRCKGRFEKEGQRKRLVGVDGQDIQAASFKEISKEIHPSNVLFALCHQVTDVESSQTIHPSM